MLPQTCLSLIFGVKMSIETHLPFWTPVLTPCSVGDEPFLNDCSSIVEKYFYWGSQAASQLNDREVQLIQMPAQHANAFAEVVCAVLTALSYLTVIVPIIMAIAKCILRCGKEYVIINQSAPEEREAISRDAATRLQQAQEDVETDRQQNGRQFTLTTPQGDRLFETGLQQPSNENAGNSRTAPQSASCAAAKNM